MKTAPRNKIKQLAKECYADMAIMVVIEKRNGVIGYTSYGKDRNLCKEVNLIANRIYDLMLEDEKIDL